MNRKLMFSGADISLDQTEAAIMDEMQAALDMFYEKYAFVESYKETSEVSCEFCIRREYKGDVGTAVKGCICSMDMSMLTGFVEDAFMVTAYMKPILDVFLTPVEPIFYAPNKDFEKIWKKAFKAMDDEDVKTIKVSTTPERVVVTIDFKEKQTVKTDVHEQN